MNEDTLAAAAQISQTDIIERQAESIARLKRQVEKGNEYKQLTKSKLKEAAARLKEYRVRVETLLGEVATLKKQSNEEKRHHEKTKKLYQSALTQSVKPIKHTTNATTQTMKLATATCMSQTVLSGQVEQVVRRIMVDQEAQTVDEWTSRKRQRNEKVWREEEQVMPKVSNHSEKDPMDDVFTAEKQILEPLGGTAFISKTSAALDAELALSDLEDERSEGDAIFELPLRVVDENATKLETLDDKERSEILVDERVSLLNGVDEAVFNGIDEELGSSTEEEDESREENSNEMGDGRTLTSGETKVGVSKGFGLASVKEEKDVAEHIQAVDAASEKERTLKSIDDELDDEFAALDADDESEKLDNVTSSSSSTGLSSDSDSSDSSSDSDEDKTDLTIRGDDWSMDKSLTEVKVKSGEEAIAQGRDHNDTQRVSSSLSLDRDALPVPRPSDIATPFDALNDIETSLLEPSTHSLESNANAGPMIGPKEKKTLSKPSDDDATSFKEAPDDVMPRDSDEVNNEGHRCVAKQRSSVSLATEGPSNEKIRKAHDVNLEDLQATKVKKIKLHRTNHVEPIASQTTKTKEATTKTKQKLSMKKILAKFKRSLALIKGEERNKSYIRRTFAILVKRCSIDVDMHVDHMTTLCQVLADTYRKFAISPMLVVRGSLSIFRTPRTRRLMQDRKPGLSWLCNQVLTRVMCRNSNDLAQDGAVAPQVLSLSLLDECLLYLSDLLVQDRTDVGGYQAENRAQTQATMWKSNVSHDKVFLAHICGLHTHLCRSFRQLARSRVLLFDLVRENPNIVGLYLAMGMLTIYPAILEREFDDRCMERQAVLKEVLQQALVVMAGVAAARQELLLRQSSITMLHAIAEALGMPELEKLDGNDATFQRTCVEKVFEKVATRCRSSASHDQDEKVESSEYFALAKSLELCTAVFGLDLVMETFRLERCQELYSKANVDNRMGLMKLVGHIAMTKALPTNNSEDPSTKYEHYVESLAEWMHDVLSSEDEEASSDERFKLRLECSTVCVALVLEYSSAISLGCRKRLLCAVVQWFESIPSDQAMAFSSSFLRQLRLAVVAARPPLVSK